MKKIFFKALFLFISVAALAQDVDENSSSYKTGYWIGKNILWIILGIVLLVVLIRMMKKKNKPPQQQG